ncbi:MAG: hypothetical protein LBJ72_01220, partial [Dysgonamonadaceae bacterium]|nr:hypothetical protein [Dysgonamonadaceae bacterium]
RRRIGSKSVKRRGKLANRSADHPPDAVSWANENSTMKNDVVSRANCRQIIQLTASGGQTKIQPSSRRSKLGK